MSAHKKSIICFLLLVFCCFSTSSECKISVQKNDGRCSFIKPVVSVGLFGGVFLFILNQILRESSKKSVSRGERDWDPHCYRGVPVTPENLYSFSPKMPRDVVARVKTWFEKNPDAWRILVRQEGPFEKLDEKRRRGFRLLNKMGIKFSKKSANFVFLFPWKSNNNDQWMVKISGPHNRACLQVAHQNHPYGRIDLVDKRKRVSTCQTASRVFYLRMLKEAVKTYRLNEIETVDGYLWSPYGSADDKKVVYLEKKLEHHVLLDKCSDETLRKILNFERVRQLLCAAAAVGLWNLTGDNIAVNKKNKKLVIFDTEQPNTMKNTQLFNKDKKRYLHNASCAFSSFYEFCKKRNLEKAARYTEFCKKNSIGVKRMPN